MTYHVVALDAAGATVKEFEVAPGDLGYDLGPVGLDHQLRHIPEVEQVVITNAATGGRVGVDPAIPVAPAVEA